MHLKVEQCQTIHVVSTFTGQNESTVSTCIVDGGPNDNQNQSKMPPCAHLGQQSKLSVD